MDELDLGSQLNIFVRVGVESTLERSQITRDHMGQLLFQLVQQGLLPKPQFYKGSVHQLNALSLSEELKINKLHLRLTSTIKMCKNS